MGMGIMRVGVEMLEVIQHRIYPPAIITGTQASFTIRQRLVITGHLVPVVVPILIFYIYLAQIYAKRLATIDVMGMSCVV